MKESTRNTDLGPQSRSDAPLYTSETERSHVLCLYSSVLRRTLDGVPSGEEEISFHPPLLNDIVISSISCKVAPF